MELGKVSSKLLNNKLSKLVMTAVVPVLLLIVTVCTWPHETYAEEITYAQVHKFTQEILKNEGVNFWSGDIVYTTSYHINKQNLLDVDEFVDAAMERLSAVSGIPVRKYDGSGKNPNFLIISTDDISTSINLNFVREFIGGVGQEGYEEVHNSLASVGNGYGTTFRLVWYESGAIQKYIIIHNPITLTGQDAVASVIGGLIRGFIPSLSESNELRPSVYNRERPSFEELLPIPEIDSKFVGSYYKKVSADNGARIDDISAEFFKSLDR